MQRKFAPPTETSDKNKGDILGLINRSINSLKKNGLQGSWRCAKNLVRQYVFRHRNSGDFKYVSADDGYTHYIPYEAEYEENIDFSGKSSDIKPIAFYLPQYHSIPENDEWWGKDFCEWVNTKKSVPDFEGHYQPRTPHKDIGFYKLDDIDVMRRQAELARSHGIYGFCFYYYWFSGKRLLEKPVDMLLNHPEIDIDFCLCWANENWTRTWDGQQKDILIGQEYSQNDAQKFIEDLVPYLSDKRYIRVDGKPVIIVYNSRLIPDVKNVFSQWRECAQKLGIGDILIWICDTDDSDAKSLGIIDAIDGEVEFPPHNCRDDRIAVKSFKTDRNAHLYNYKKLVDLERGRYENINTEKPVYRAVMSSWDNACRRKEDYTAFYAYSSDVFYRWVRLAVNNARESHPEESRFIFVNAWNEWAEGTYLEPDEKYGYNTINTFSRALYGYPLEQSATPIFGKKECPAKFSVAVQIHLFFVDTIDEIIKNINLIPCPFDCYISTDTEEKKELIAQKFNLCNARNVTVEVLENKGRDVAPFLKQMRERIDQYDIICHIHSKKTTFADYGDFWRKYLFNNLFGCSDNIAEILDMFKSNEKLGIIFPETYPLIKDQQMFGADRDNCVATAQKLGITEPLPQRAMFPAGNMFWARTDAVRQMFLSDAFSFESEKGQVHFTDAHRVERLWVYLAKHNGFNYKKTINFCDLKSKPEKRGTAIFAHYDKGDVLSDDDLKLITAVKEQVDTLIFVSTSALGGLQTARLEGIADQIVLRENIGFDFTSFKGIIEQIGKEELKKTSRLILCNNSIKLACDNLDNMFFAMDKTADFWGINGFPESSDGLYLGQKKIRRHLQSYFLVFENNVLQSEAFYRFFAKMPAIRTLKDAISYGESRLTFAMNQAGFTDNCFVGECYIAPAAMKNYALPYEYPYEMLMLGMPFIKKKCYYYASDEQLLLLDDFLGKLNK